MKLALTVGGAILFLVGMVIILAIMPFGETVVTGEVSQVAGLQLLTLPMIAGAALLISGAILFVGGCLLARRGE